MSDLQLLQHACYMETLTNAEGSRPIYARHLASNSWSCSKQVAYIGVYHCAGWLGLFFFLTKEVFQSLFVRDTVDDGDVCIGHGHYPIDESIA